MNNFHGVYKKKSYFEGWYLKHQDKKNTVSVIPAFHIDKNGKKTATIQVITDNNSYFTEYRAEDFKVSKKKFRVRIGANFFSDRGMNLNIKTDEASIEGTFQYGQFTPIKRNIMGPFQFIPFMQCNHGIVSLFHNIYGNVCINNKKIEFREGIGYIEKDWGRSFPNSYLWTQCNCFSEAKCCIMLSIASIPIIRGRFTGCIGVVYYNNQEYRFATYYGVKIMEYTKDEVFICQGNYSLHVQLLQKNELILKAPHNGEMVRKIKESPSCLVRYRFLKKANVIFDMFSDRAGFECCLNNQTD